MRSEGARWRAQARPWRLCLLAALGAACSFLGPDDGYYAGGSPLAGGASGASAGAGGASQQAGAVAVDGGDRAVAGTHSPGGATAVAGDGGNPAAGLAGAPLGGAGAGGDSASGGCYGKGWRLAFHEKFDAPLSPIDWTRHVGPPDNHSISAWVAGNVSSTSGGELELTVKNEDVIVGSQTYHYSGGGLKSKGTWTYGRYLVTARHLNAYGVESSVGIKRMDQAAGGFIFGNFTGKFSTVLNFYQVKSDWMLEPATMEVGALDSDPTTSFHEYSLTWCPDSVVFAVDGIQAAEQPNLQTESPMYLDLTVLVNDCTIPNGCPEQAGSAGTFPASLDVRDVRVLEPVKE